MNYADGSNVNLVEAFRNMQMDVEKPLENGSLNHKVYYSFTCLIFFLLANVCEENKKWDRKGPYFTWPDALAITEADNCFYIQIKINVFWAWSCTKSLW